MHYSPEPTSTPHPVTPKPFPSATCECASGIEHPAACGKDCFPLQEALHRAGKAVGLLEGADSEDPQYFSRYRGDRRPPPAISKRKESSFSYRWIKGPSENRDAVCTNRKTNILQFVFLCVN